MRLIIIIWVSKSGKFKYGVVHPTNIGGFGRTREKLWYSYSGPKIKHGLKARKFERGNMGKKIFTISGKTYTKHSKLAWKKA